ncbi:hypothetical protein NDU88_000446 [Pleurodeles waltl]|uniref:Uncharacterized protein n=1 Tax=Pleurodeles waltl TaxID=8319 RepID=A0AAV7S5P2_PLEWA|nr:hypothetical protein NDU88_000446 [Pleurodeles waltl]
MRKLALEVANKKKRSAEAKHGVCNYRQTDWSAYVEISCSSDFDSEDMIQEPAPVQIDNDHHKMANDGPSQEKEDEALNDPLGEYMIDL